MALKMMKECDICKERHELIGAEISDQGHVLGWFYVGLKAHPQNAFTEYECCSFNCACNAFTAKSKELSEIYGINDTEREINE